VRHEYVDEVETENAAPPAALAAPAASAAEGH
jgi:hypothetical protein